MQTSQLQKESITNLGGVLLFCFSKELMCVQMFVSFYAWARMEKYSFLEEKKMNQKTNTTGSTPAGPWTSFTPKKK